MIMMTYCFNSSIVPLYEIGGHLLAALLAFQAL